MTLLQVEKRVKALEKKVQRLSQGRQSSSAKWYRTHAGRFANDPDFDEIVKLGREYRQSLKPQAKSKPS